MWVALWLPLPDSCCKLPDLGTPALLCLGQIIIKSNMLLPKFRRSSVQSVSIDLCGTALDLEDIWKMQKGTGRCSRCELALNAGGHPACRLRGLRGLFAMMNDLPPEGIDPLQSFIAAV